MNEIHNIIEELNASNGSNHKIAVLTKHKDNALLRRVLKLTYDKATYSFGLTARGLDLGERSSEPFISLSDALDMIEKQFVTRETTGNAAMDLLKYTWQRMDTPENADLLLKIINRDLRINMGRSNINKVIKGLIVKPVYMRCDTYNEKTAKKFNFTGAFIQLKADGTYREFNVQQGNGVTCMSRQGEEYSYPEIEKILLDTGINGVFFGELTVYRDGVLLDRATGNGLLRKDEFPDDCKVVFDCWDVVSLEEYNGAIDKKKGKHPYFARWSVVQSKFPDHTADPLTNPVRAIECVEVNTAAEALAFTAEVMNRGLEGTIAKERRAIFRDGTSQQQLKLKLEIDLEVRVTGFLEGTPGTVREATFGSMTFETDDGEIKGSTSGFTNAQLEDFNSRRAELIGKVMTVTCNDITKGRDNDYHALSHPRFVEFRDDKTTTDTLASALDAKAMAMMVDSEVKAA
ncbi:MAG: hypothetical protein LPK02_07505 [Rhodobacterales bacterium]|nr:hypothetical protein [Rhodobacterales bacterium]